MADATVTYLFDPLCGWCYGATPMLERLAEAGHVLELLPTGLFSGPGARPMDAGFASHIWSADQRIQRITGQAFTEIYRDKILGVPGGLIDSAAATLAISAASHRDPAKRFAALKAIQRGRYVEGREIVTAEGVAAVLADAGMAEAASGLKKPTPEIMAAHEHLLGRGRALFRRLQANGVPALAVIRNETPQLIGANALFGSLDNLLAHIRAA